MPSPWARLRRVTPVFVRLDLQGLVRDDVLLLNLGASVGMVVVIAVIGAFKSTEAAWIAWFPPLVAISILTGPNSWGFLFGLLMVDEQDSGVRAAISVSPVPAAWLVIVRSLTAFGLQIVWPLISVFAMNATWNALNITFLEWVLLFSGLALGAPATALALAAFAGNKVEALALYKGINFLVIAPLALYLVPDSAFFRPLFYIFPAAWGLSSFEALRLGEPAGFWLVGNAAYHGAILFALGRAYVRRSIGAA